MADTKALVGTIDDAEGFLGSFCAIPGFNRRETRVAIAAVLGGGFVKVSEQGMTPAGCQFTKAQHGVQFDLFNPFVLFVPLGTIEHLPQFGHVLKAVNHPCRGCVAITPGPAGLLIVRLDGFR